MVITQLPLNTHKKQRKALKIALDVAQWFGGHVSQDDIKLHMKTCNYTERHVKHTIDIALNRNLLKHTEYTNIQGKQLYEITLKGMEYIKNRLNTVELHETIQNITNITLTHERH